MTRRVRRHALAPRFLAGSLAATATMMWTAYACVSPREPRLLESADAVLVAPRLLYEEALDRAIDRLPELHPSFAAVPPRPQESPLEQSRRIDLAIVADALGIEPAPESRPERARATGAGAEDRGEPDVSRSTPAQEAYAAYATAREAVFERRVARDRSFAWRHWSPPDDEPPPPLPSESSIPALVPREHALYMAGLLALEGDDAAAAVERWSSILELPEVGRRARSVWAAFQSGRALEASDPDAARRWFERTRELAVAGLDDPLGLAAASLGYEARVDLHAGRFAESILLYGMQHAAGDPTAPDSLRLVAAQLLGAEPDAIAAVAADPRAAPLVTAALASDHPLSFQPPDGERARWLSALAAHGPDAVPEAGALALVAYRAAEFEDARRWIARAADDALAHWVASKLALLDGDLAKADAALVRALDVPDDGPTLAREPRTGWGDDGVPFRRTLLGELGAVRLALGRPTDALHLMIQAERWDDAAYVAERVLTLAELEAYAAANWRAPRPEGSPDARGPGEEWTHDHDPGTWTRSIVGRRLARAGRWSAAAEWFDDASRRSLANELHRLTDAADRTDTPPRERARALWNAATRLRRHGMSLMGTWNGPDGGRTDGAFAAETIDLVVQERRQNHVVPPTPAELERVARHGVFPEQRFHYRYLAADLAYEASLLLPDRDPDLALLLCIAGKWLANTDPQEADRFYKDLVWRCRPLPLAEEADRLRWFPPCDGEPFAGDEGVGGATKRRSDGATE